MQLFIKKTGQNNREKKTIIKFLSEHWLQCNGQSVSHKVDNTGRIEHHLQTQYWKKYNSIMGFQQMRDSIAILLICCRSFYGGYDPV